MAIKCPKCDFDNPEDLSFCGKCGTQLPSPEKAEVTETLETPKEELTTGSTFAERYQIIEELGKGGMGRVYKANDVDIKEKIAIKLIKPEISTDKKTIERFQNELKFARKIRHKNVCQMYDLNREEGTYYITMEYVEGENLKNMIRMSGQLGIGTAISIASQVCEGLAEAHKLGVVHRDLKPSNIMIDREGNVRIMDFGIARSLKEKSITGAGVMIGTPEYMSPEQVEGKEVDQWSDIYSLGVILYEMLTGKVPFEGDTPFIVGVKHKSEIPRDPKEFNIELSEDLCNVIMRCLEKDKEKRFQSVGEVRSELENIKKGIPTTKRIVPERKPLTSKEITVTFRLKKLFIPAIVILSFAIIIVIIWKLLPKREAVSQFSTAPSIVVLPFKDMSPQKDQEFFCDGLSEELITALSQIKGLKVVARTSAFSFKGKELDIREIGKILNVSTILEGSVRIADNKLRIVAQLINVADGYHLWSERYERNLDDVFSIQDDISIAIADKLKPELLGEDKIKLTKRYTRNPEAHNFYLKGRFFWNRRTEESLEKAIYFFGEAIKADPAYTSAYIGMAESYAVLPDYSSYSRNKALEKVNEALEKALDIDANQAEAYASSAYIKMTFEWDWKAAELEFKRAIELSPGYATAHHWYAILLQYTARFDDAIRAMNRALELDPLSIIANRNLGILLFFARRFDEALEALQRTLEMDPDFYLTHYYLGRTYFNKTMYDEALAHFREEKIPALAWTQASEMCTGITYLTMGKTKEAQEILQNLLKESGSEGLQAIINLSLGNKNKALKWLDKAYDERDILLIYLKIDPFFDTVRSDPKFVTLLKKMGLD